jgi:Flp pilus assembly protein TadG
MRWPADGRASHERGQILVIFTLMVVVLILAAGLVVDGGGAFLNRRDSQNSADIGALAGTKRLADYYVHGTAFKPSDNAFTAIATRMTQNGCTAAARCSWTAHYIGPRTGATFPDLGVVGRNDVTVPGAASGQKAMGIRVDLAKQAPTYFLGVLGQHNWNIATTGTAISGQPNGAPSGQILPIGLVNPPTMDDKSIYAITSGSNGPGNFGWLSWTGSNDPNALATSLCTPNNPAFTLPAQFDGDPGKSNSTSVRACLQTWVDNHQTVLIPIVLASNDPNAPAGCSTGANGNNFHYCVVSLAAFTITSFSQPAVDQINGMFKGTIPYSMGDSVPGGLTGPPASNSKFYFMGLVQ